VASSRKFLFGVDVVPGSSFDAILVGTGDREHPLASNGAFDVANRFYMLKDTNIGFTGAAMGIVDTCGATVDTTTGTGCTNLFDATNSSSVPASATGWLVSLATGEEVVNSPLVAAGTTYFGTNQPDAANTSCSANLGIARRYAIDFLTGAGNTYTDTNGNLTRSEMAIGGGFLPTPVGGVVEIGSQKVPFVTDNPLNPGGTIQPPISVTSKRYRTYWRQILE
jgi:type IV pilus assembly protein PilY1